AAAHYELQVPAGGSALVRVRLRRVATGAGERTSVTRETPKPISRAMGVPPVVSTPDAFTDFAAVFATRRAEADAFYAELQRDLTDDDAKLVQRQALAGMIWSKQFFYYNVREWM